MNQNVVVNVPGLDEAQAARAEMSVVLPQSAEEPEREWDISELAGASNSDVHYVLARLRIDLERELRRILGKRTRFDEPAQCKANFSRRGPCSDNWERRLNGTSICRVHSDYILEVCNAAIHGQRVRSVLPMRR